MDSDICVLNAVYCSSDLFTEVCGVSIISLFENNKHLPDIHVYVIDDGITEKNRSRIKEIAVRYARTITFIALPDPAAFYNDKRFTISSLGHTYARLILGDVLPEQVKRVISLDSDTLVLDRVDELWNTDMGDYPIAGVDDCMGQTALVKTQHLERDAVHCNAGMYLINLCTWREEGWTEKFHQYIKGVFDRGKSLGGYEEEVIAKVTGDRMMVLPPKFNLMTLEQILSYKELMKFRGPLNYYSEEEIEEAKRHPVITHATNFFYVQKRIFEKDSDHPMRGRYETYRALSPWKDEPPMDIASTPKQLAMKKVWHLMPRKMALVVARFVRNEVRPLLEKKRDDE